MNKKMNKLLSICLTVCLVAAIAGSAGAAPNPFEITASGGNATTPISLTTTNDGMEGGGDNVTPTKLSVTVPTVLPLAMTDTGDIVTADNCEIVNNSYGSVRVKTATIASASLWHLTAFGPKASLAAEKVDSNKLGFSMKLGTGSAVQTTNSGDSQQLISAPVTGCYMSGSGNASANTVAVDYDAIVTPLSSTVDHVTVANIVFVIEWDFV